MRIRSCIAVPRSPLTHPQALRRFILQNIQRVLIGLSVADGEVMLAAVVQPLVKQVGSCAHSTSHPPEHTHGHVHTLMGTYTLSSSYKHALSHTLAPRVGLMGDYSDTEMNLFCHMARHEALTLAQALVMLDVTLAIAMQDVVFSKVTRRAMCGDVWTVLYS